MSGVSLKKVVKAYGQAEVVHGIDLEIAPQEFVVLVGPSGCAKSTTLRMIAGLEEITGGTVSIGDRVVNKVAPKDRDVAMVFQNYALYPHLNVAENIAFGLRIRKADKEHIETSVKEVSEILGLTPYLERRPADLSGGQRQRVAMGRAIVRHPEVFLFDEPLSNLDAKLRTQMRAEIKRLHKRLGVTSIYVTHDQVEAMTLADRIVVMQAGNIEQVGSPMELFSNPINTFVATFLGSPPMNMLDGVIESAGNAFKAKLLDGTVLDLPVMPNGQLSVGQQVLVGIRPEHIALTDPGHGNSLPISLDLVEPLGSEALLHAMIGDRPFVVKAETAGDVRMFDQLDRIYLDPQAIKVFDKESGLSLSYEHDRARAAA